MRKTPRRPADYHLQPSYAELWRELSHSALPFVEMSSEEVERRLRGGWQMNCAVDVEEHSPADASGELEPTLDC